MVSALLFLTAQELGALVRSGGQGTTPRTVADHPIGAHLRDGRQRWTAKVNTQTASWSEFADTYRSRYALEVPEGMYRWWFLAKEAAFPLIDEFDEIMASLELFRALDGAEVKRRTRAVADLPTFSLLTVNL